MQLKVKNDFIFQKLFSDPKNKDILESLLEAILMVDLTDITVIENKKLEQEMPEDKLGILDVRAKINGDTKVNIEIQLTNQHNMDKRTLFYWSKMYIEQFRIGRKYKELEKTITINLLDFSWKRLPEKYHNIYELRERSDTNHKLTDILEIHFIEFPKFNNREHTLDASLERWLTFIDNPSKEVAEMLQDKEEQIGKAYDILEILSRDEETVRLYELREKAIHDEISKMSDAREDGIQQGIQQGIQKGIEQGIEQGIEKAKLETIKNGIALGLDQESLCVLTGISLVELKKVLEKI